MGILPIQFFYLSYVRMNTIYVANRGPKYPYQCWEHLAIIIILTERFLFARLSASKSINSEIS